jgi:hypothetical protein
MCKRNTSIIMAGLTLGGLLLMGSPAGAQSVYDPNVDQRQDHQQVRIQQGADAGALTPGETQHLERQQGHIQATEDHMTRDGRLSFRERQRLAEMQARANRDIYRHNHNGRTGDDWRGGNHNGWGNHANSGWNNRGNYGGDGRQYAGWDDQRRPYDPRFDHRQDYQQERIHQGVRTGNLTPGEARYLEREQGRIQAAEDRMRADGRLSPWERQRLNQMQNQANRDIYRLSNNGRTDPGYGPHQRGWQGPHQGWGGNGSWQGHPQGGYGATPGGAPVTNAAAGGTGPAGNGGWWGNRAGGSGSSAGAITTTGTTTPGTGPGTDTAGNTTGWRGNHYGGSGSPTPSTPTGGTTAAGNNQGWQGRQHTGWSGTAPSGTGTAGATPAPGNPQGWQGNNTHNGPRGAFQPGPAPQARNFGQPANWQGQPRFQQARPQSMQPMMRSPNNMMARQPGGFTGPMNRAPSPAPRVAPRRR